MNLQAYRHGFVAALAVCVLSETVVWQTQLRAHLQVVGNATSAQPVPQFPPRPRHPGVPYPNSTDAEEVMANIDAILQRSRLAEASPIPIDELIAHKARKIRLRPRRILDVTGDGVDSYLVVELESPTGDWVANVALTKSGDPIMIEDARGRNLPRSLDLSVAASRVETKRRKKPLSAHYVYFHNVAEKGLSFCRPLAAVTTESGVVYLNSNADAFVEDKTPLAAEFGVDKQPMPQTAVKPLRPVGRW